MKNKKSKEENSIGRIIILMLIAIVCVVAIFEAVYVMIFSVDGTLENVTTSVTNNIEVDEKEVLKDNFQTIFKNDIVSNVDTVNIPKKDNKYNLVYVAYNKVEKSTGKYDLDVQIPHININSTEIDNINNEIDKIFINKAETIIAENSNSENIVYSIKYRAYVNNDILSLIIECTLKEGSNAQRIIIKTYNYNIQTGKVLTIEDLAQLKQLNKNIIESKIKDEINSQISMEKSLVEAGYSVFNRYPESDMYKYENLSNIFIDEKDNLYIIFAYGNTNNTSELDLVIL